MEIAEEVVSRFAVRMESDMVHDWHTMPESKEAQFDVLFVQNRATKGDGIQFELAHDAFTVVASKPRGMLPGGRKA